MNPYATRAAEIEAAFLAGARTNLEQAKGAELRGYRWSSTSPSQEARVRELVVAAGQDREVLRSLPKNQSYVLTGSQPRWFFWRRRASVAIASVLSPIEHYISGEGQPSPIGLGDLVAHVKELVGEMDVPHVVGVCSPTGFSEEAKHSGLELPNVTLVLVEAREDGGWEVMPASPNATPAQCRLFDPEAVTQKLKRIRQEIDLRGADLLAGGLEASAVGRSLGLPTHLVAAAFEQAARDDPELKLSRRHDEVLLFRGAPAEMEDSDMSMVDRIRQLLSGEGDEARKINTLSERRARLVQRRERLYADITQLEKHEAELLKEGREAASSTAKLRVASQIKQLREDMNRLNGTARMLGQQVDIISTHIHNLTLLQQGKMAKLPTTEDITADAVRAEEMLEELAGQAELTGSLNTMAAAGATSEEELAILKELEGTAAEGRAETQPTPPTSAASPLPGAKTAKKEPEGPEPQAG